MRSWHSREMNRFEVLAAEEEVCSEPDIRISKPANQTRRRPGLTSCARCTLDAQVPGCSTWKPLDLGSANVDHWASTTGPVAAEDPRWCWRGRRTGRSGRRSITDLRASDASGGGCPPPLLEPSPVRRPAVERRASRPHRRRSSRSANASSWIAGIGGPSRTDSLAAMVTATTRSTTACRSNVSRVGATCGCRGVPRRSAATGRWPTPDRGADRAIRQRPATANPGRGPCHHRRPR